MNEQNTTINLTKKKEGFKILKIASVVVLLFWLFWCLLYLWSKEESVLSNTLEITQLQDEIKEVSAKLLQLKQNKQQCKDWLTEYQTLAEYKGIQFFCNGTDAEIEQLKNRLAAMLTMPYEQLDSHLEDGKQEQQMKMLAEWTWSAIDKLVSFLESE